MPDSGVSDYDYRQRVRRYKPSSLLPLIAIAAIRYREQQAWLNNLKYRPWALADAARVSLAYGTEHNRTEATDRGLFQILDAYSRFDDPLLRDHDARAFMLRMAGEQMPWQADDFRALARTAAIFSQTPSRKPMECLLPGWDTELFGCTLQEYVGTAQLVWVGAISCAGWFDLGLFDTPDGKLIARHISRDTVVQVLDAHFATNSEQFRVENRNAIGPARVADELRRFTYNPLRGHPLLTGFGTGYLCPIPQLVWAKASPWGVYFTGLDRYGERFTRDLGHLFEQYIGRQLGLLPDAEVLPEISYMSSTGGRETVDWIVVLPEVVLLVEVKSAIPTEPVRLGTPDAVEAHVSKLGKAIRQIDATAQLITDRHAALSAVPKDRPVLGLAVTLEAFHIANAAFDLLPPSQTPVTVASAAEIEDLVTITDIAPGQLLLDRAADAMRSTWALDTALNDRARSRNPILDEAWLSYPWALAKGGD